MLYITGDTHGELIRFEHPVMKKLRKDDVLIICGDFGFIWDGSLEEQKRLKQLEKRKYQILFIDGKHENFDLLDRFQTEHFCGGVVHRIAENVRHLMRGQIYEIESKKIFTFGGGESPDKEMRLSLGTWWPQEMPTIDEMKQGVKILDQADRQVDYVITHEPPRHIKKLLCNHISTINPLESFFDDLEKQVKFEKWFFGCMHIDRKITTKHYAVFSDIVAAEPTEKKRRWR